MYCAGSGGRRNTSTTEVAVRARTDTRAALSAGARPCRAGRAQLAALHRAHPRPPAPRPAGLRSRGAAAEPHHRRPRRRRPAATPARPRTGLRDEGLRMTLPALEDDHRLLRYLGPRVQPRDHRPAAAGGVAAHRRGAHPRPRHRHQGAPASPTPTSAPPTPTPATCGPTPEPAGYRREIGPCCVPYCSTATRASTRRRRCSSVATVLRCASGAWPTGSASAPPWPGSAAAKPLWDSDRTTANPWVLSKAAVECVGRFRCALDRLSGARVYQGTWPLSSKKAPRGPSSGRVARWTAVAAPCSGVRVPAKPVKSVAT